MLCLVLFFPKTQRSTQGAGEELRMSDDQSLLLKALLKSYAIPYSMTWPSTLPSDCPSLTRALPQAQAVAPT